MSRHVGFIETIIYNKQTSIFFILPPKQYFCEINVSHVGFLETIVYNKQTSIFHKVLEIIYNQNL